MLESDVTMSASLASANPRDLPASNFQGRQHRPVLPYLLFHGLWDGKLRCSFLYFRDFSKWTVFWVLLLWFYVQNSHLILISCVTWKEKYVILLSLTQFVRIHVGPCFSLPHTNGIRCFTGVFHVPQQHVIRGAYGSLLWDKITRT